MKFDIFDERTWELPQEDPYIKIRNKALGAMGQKISQLRLLKNALHDQHKFGKTYEYAERLKAANPAAYQIMQVSYVFPDAEIADLMKTIDSILDAWSDVKSREENWKSIIPYFKKLQPFLDNNYYTMKSTVDKILEVKVVGNAAWDVYLSECKSDDYWHGRCQEFLQRS